MDDRSGRTLFDKLYLLSQIIQDVCDVDDIKSVAPFLTKAQFQILKILSAAGTKTVSEIATLFNVSRPAISRTVDKLVKQHLVLRTEQEADRRSAMLSLTRLGERMITNYNGNRSRRMEKVQENFTPEEMQQFETFIERYIGTCIEYQEGLDLVCMQCDGHFSEDCSFRDLSESCYYKVRLTEKSSREEKLT